MAIAFDLTCNRAALRCPFCDVVHAIVCFGQLSYVYHCWKEHKWAWLRILSALPNDLQCISAVQACLVLIHSYYVHYITQAIGTISFAHLPHAVCHVEAVCRWISY